MLQWSLSYTVMINDQLWLSLSSPVDDAPARMFGDNVGICWWLTLPRQSCILNLSKLRTSQIIFHRFCFWRIFYQHFLHDSPYSRPRRKSVAGPREPNKLGNEQSANAVVGFCPAMRLTKPISFIWLISVCPQRAYVIQLIHWRCMNCWSVEVLKRFGSKALAVNELLY